MDLKAVKMGLKSNFANVIKSNEIYIKKAFIISHFKETFFIQSISLTQYIWSCRSV